MTTSVALPILRGPRIPETAGHSFKCEYLRGTLTGAQCLGRQTKRETVRSTGVSRVPERLEYCASGKCEQGNEIRAKFPNWKPEERTRPHASWASMGMFTGPQSPSAIAAQAAVIEKLPRAPEVPLPELDDEEEADVEEKHCKEEGCTLPLRGDNESGYCKAHSRKYQARAYRERLATKRNGTPPTAPPRRKILGRRARAAQRADAPPPSGSAPDDVEEILQRRLTYYRAEAERCERALKALRR